MPGPQSIGPEDQAQTSGQSEKNRRKNANTPLQTEVCRGVLVEDSGSVLLSQTVSRQVPLALESLTSEFGMESGGSSPPWPPENVTRLAM